ncbi:LysM peptidoglycan-binding domain-containing protein [Halalkalibaculum sp. DA384]|uniref:LysM peptidoglycan-binding domain-containing protein n=1 Tax=Halalkalibaculum sp. DA384 TaxID=3373606 RepID=UPI003753F0E5
MKNNYGSKQMNRIGHSIHTLFKAGLILVLLLGWHSAAQAQGQQTHTVRAGETLFNISKQYDVSVQQLREWNDLQNDELRVGQTLVVGQPSGEPPTDTITHEVQPRETLFSISKQYQVTIPELKRWNDLSGNDLEIGRELTIYPSESPSGALPDTAGRSLVVNTPASSNTYYTVKSGDSLYKIAREHNMTIDELKSLNDLTSNTIRVGQQLTVRKVGQAAPSVAENIENSTPQGAFVVHTVESGSTLQSLLNRFDMTEPEFRALNPDISSIQSGQQVTVLLPPSRSHPNPYSVKSNLKNLGQTLVSVYSENQIGTTTTSGELYNPDELTAAHSNIALGNVIFVQNPGNSKGIYVRINDRFSGEGLRLSHAALQALELNTSGNATVNMFQDQ